MHFLLFMAIRLPRCLYKAVPPGFCRVFFFVIAKNAWSCYHFFKNLWCRFAMQSIFFMNWWNCKHKILLLIYYVTTVTIAVYNSCTHVSLSKYIYITYLIYVLLFCMLDVFHNYLKLCILKAKAFKTNFQKQNHEFYKEI